MRTAGVNLQLRGDLSRSYPGDLKAPPRWYVLGNFLSERRRREWRLNLVFTAIFQNDTGKHVKRKRQKVPLFQPVGLSTSIPSLLSTLLCQLLQVNENQRTTGQSTGTETHDIPFNIAAMFFFYTTSSSVTMERNFEHDQQPLQNLSTIFFLSFFAMLLQRS